MKNKLIGSFIGGTLSVTVSYLIKNNPQVATIVATILSIFVGVAIIVVLDLLEKR